MKQHNRKWSVRLLAFGIIAGVLTVMIAPNYMTMPPFQPTPYGYYS